MELALTIPRGRVSTYGDIARAAGGAPITAQSITGILSKAEQSGVKGIPWHRLIYSDGRVWVSEEHREERMRLYKKESIEIDDKGKVVDFDSLRF